jgi:hypothetical protein
LIEIHPDFLIGQDTVTPTLTFCERDSRLPIELALFPHNLALIPINGTVWPTTVGSPLQHLSRVLGDPQQHLVALLQLDNRLQFFISLFGDINGMVSITRDSDICSLIPDTDGIIIQINPQTRFYQRRTFMDLLLALSKQADEGSGLPHRQ